MQDVTFDVAPWDVLGNHESVGQIVVAKEGEPLLKPNIRKENLALFQ